MRYIFSLFLIVLAGYMASAGPIDSLKTKDDVRSFLKKHDIEAGEVDGALFKEDYKKINWPDPWFSGTDSFYIVDIDKNGYSDIIIDVAVFSVLLDMGRDSFKQITLSRSSDDKHYSYKGLLLTDTLNCLLVKTLKRDYINGRMEDIVGEDTIIYKDGFIDYIPNIETEAIHQLTFEYTPGFCFDCNPFILKINADRTASYSSIKRNSKKQRLDSVNAATVLDANRYQRLLTLINDANFSRLQDRFSVGATDHPHGELIIIYGDNKVKKIHDYGLRGTLALRKVYDELFAIQAANTWTIKVTKRISPKIRR